ncbi:MAG: acylneuraminate cytidylyltransferase family protein [Bacteroidales bacterium]|nr:acylneuraminate cytidylyltransferase family protein [Bacteroidales bacterium]
MISNRSVLAVVPARGGSKGIPLKNLRVVGGRPLVARVGDVVREVPEIDRAVVSTDHDEIAQVAEEAGLAAPFRRPEALSGDRIGDFDVLIHALETCERLDGRRYDIVVMLQPTSPLRSPRMVSDTLRMLVDEAWDSVWTVSETDSKGHPLKQLTVRDGEMDYYDRAGAGIVARQQLVPVFHRNGIAYAITRECLVEQRTIKGRRSGALVLPGEHVSIDTEWDIDLIDFILARRALDRS